MLQPGPDCRKRLDQLALQRCARTVYRIWTRVHGRSDSAETWDPLPVGLRCC